MIRDEIRSALEKALQEANSRVLAFQPAYSQAREFSKVFGKEKIEQYRAKVKDSEELMQAILQTGEDKKSALKQKLAGKSLLVEMPVNTNGPILIYTPVKRAAHERNSLEEDLLLHVANSARCTGAGIANPADHSSEFISLAANLDNTPKNIREVAGRLANVPDAMKLANISIAPYVMSVPLIGYLRTHSITVKMTPSAIDYSLIPVRKCHRDFFPGYKQEFDLDTPIGTIGVWVTSQTPGRGVGNYICSRGDGMLGGMIERMGIDVGSELSITEVAPKRRYSLSKVEKGK